MAIRDFMPWERPAPHGLAEFLRQEPRKFRPTPFWEQGTDSLIFYWEDAKSFSRCVDEDGHVHAMLAVDDERVVGVDIQGVKAWLESQAKERTSGP